MTTNPSQATAMKVTAELSSSSGEEAVVEPASLSSAILVDDQTVGSKRCSLNVETASVEDDDLAAAMESKLRINETDKVGANDTKSSAVSTATTKTNGAINCTKDDAERHDQTSTTTTTTTELSSRTSVLHESSSVPSNNAGAPARLVQIANWIDQAQHILVLTGAGVSVAAGIPDFRTPGTGLYDNLQKYNLPYAEAVFDIDYYPRNPQPFVQLASELWPNDNDASAPKPTLTHCFVALLAAKDKLERNYSQNIDGLEHMAGIPTEKLIECHGHFRTARCLRCKKEASIESVKDSIVTHQKAPVCVHCGKSNKKPAYVKPDIVFFGEQLPPIFHHTLPKDLQRADVCLILGTSLQVPPTANIPDMVSSSCRRILLNRELVGHLRIPSSDDDSVVDPKGRDAFHAGDCDDSILWIARLLGWEEELQARYKETRKSK